ncbi:MAG: hypothetical protein LBE16_02365 [Clostridiales Family XIII bacterium]|jgi:hypothetical protein|nr:hypothetical protein [Clostridiales Family XIII bacterium]
MKAIKKIGVTAGAIVGGVIGGSISFAGKLAGVKFVDEIGESIVDSAIYTGSIAGKLASGATDLAAGKLAGDEAQTRAGVRDLKDGGRQVVGNVVENVKTVAENGGELLNGIRERDGKRVLRGAKTLAKVVVVGAVTVGAIRVKKSDDSAP